MSELWRELKKHITIYLLFAKNSVMAQMEGLIYQVQASTNLTTWQNLGSPRFAVGAVDSLYIGLSRAEYYRVMWLH